MVVTREVEEAEQITVADVEEEVRRALVVTVLDEIDQREAQHVLIEADGLFDVAADQGHVMESPSRRRRSLAEVAQIGLAEFVAPGADRLELGSLWLGHEPVLLEC